MQKLWVNAPVLTKRVASSSKKRSLSSNLPLFRKCQHYRQSRHFSTHSPLPKSDLNLAHFVAQVKEKKIHLNSTTSSSSSSLSTPLPSATPFSPVPLPLDEESSITRKKCDRSFYVETYGCQMNTSDTEIVCSILSSSGMKMAPSVEVADVILLNTCAIRDNPEQRVWRRLGELKLLRKKNPRSEDEPQRLVGVLGCMAERLKTKLLESDKLVDVVAGPDSYRDLPRLLTVVEETGQKVHNTLLSLDETYADLTPVRRSDNKVSAFVTIMRGCENMCSFCIVPYTRGRERSRDIGSIIEEVKLLSQEGYKEITLLGQNVNSYNFNPEEGKKVLSETKEAHSRGFTNISRRPLPKVTFTELLRQVSEVDPNIRIRFTSPHPKDFPDDLLYLIREKKNLCKQIHIPAQSGSTTVLERMRRGYSRDAYLQLVDLMHTVLGRDMAISTDMITGFCGETEDEHADSKSLMEQVKYDQAFMFKYSQREKTHAHRHYSDDVTEEVKARRLSEIQQIFRTELKKKSKRYIGTKQLVLIDEHSTKNPGYLYGRTDTNKRVSVPQVSIPLTTGDNKLPTVGDFVEVRVTSAGTGALTAVPVRFSSPSTFLP